MQCRKCGTTANVHIHGVTPVCDPCWDRFVDAIQSFENTLDRHAQSAKGA